ncbi:UDP-glycosyltransferase UGT5-like isoform X2 [Leptidea sinapis]|nr:UDP-glycosyltransferase UGT5-like isoform X2 [Leptidea sinapis]
MRTIGLELSRRGHNVTVITAYKENEHPPNYHQIKVQATSVWDSLGFERPNVFSMADLSDEVFHQNFLWPGGLAITEMALASPAVQELLRSDAKFDLVISEQFFQEAFYVLAHKYEAPLALVTSFGNCMKHNFFIRNPLQWSTVTYELLMLDNPKSFFGRLRNMYFSLYELFWWKYWYLSKQEELMRKYIPALPQPIPNLVDIQKNASLMLVNRHFSVDSSIAYLPNVVEIGGVHITKTNTTLPKDLQTILDEAKHGVVYVNFGSNVRSSELPDEKKQAFLNVFRRLRQTVIWKWEDDELKGKSDNVITRQWFPQKDILNHPNIKVFISHGGLIGTQEAIYGGVPIIGIPIYGDQLNNLFSIEELGIGRILRYHDINEENLFELLSEFVNTDAYKKKAEEVSRRYLDRPMSALDTAVFWLEYVIRNNGAPYMKSPALELNWWAYTMLDVYIFLAVTLTLTMFVIIKILIFVKMILMTQKSNIKSKKS